MARIFRTLAVLLGVLAVALATGHALPTNDSAGSRLPVLLDVGADACPCEAPPCACPQPKQLVEAEEVHHCQEGEACPQAAPPACQQDNSCEQLVKPKTVDKVSGLGTVVVKNSGAGGSSSEGDESSTEESSAAAAGGASASSEESTSDSTSASASGVAAPARQAAGQQQAAGSDSESSDASVTLPDPSESSDEASDAESSEESEASGAAAEESSEESTSAEAAAARPAAGQTQAAAAASGATSEESTEESTEASTEESSDEESSDEESSEEASEESSSAATSTQQKQQQQKQEQPKQQAAAAAATESSEESSEEASGADVPTQSAEDSSADAALTAAQKQTAAKREAAAAAAGGAASAEESSVEESSEESSAAATGLAQQAQQPKAVQQAKAQTVAGSEESSEESSGADESSAEESSSESQEVDVGTQEAIKAAKGAETAATAAAKSADTAATVVAAQTETMKKQNEVRKAEAIAAKAEADALKLKLANQAKDSANKQLSDMKEQLAQLQKAQVGGDAKKSPEEKELDSEKAAQAALEKKRAEEKSEIQRLLAQLSSDKKEADSVAIKKAEDEERNAAKAEQNAEQTTKALAQKVVAAAKAQEEGSKNQKKAAASAKQKVSEAKDQEASNSAEAEKLAKRMAAILAQINADKAEASALKAKQAAEAIAEKQAAEKKIKELEAQEEDAKSAKKRIAEEGEKRAVAAEENTKEKAKAALAAQQEAAEKKAKAKVEEEASKAAAAKKAEEADKQTAKDAADLAAKKAAAAKAAAAEDAEKAAAKAAAEKELADQKAALEKQKAQLMEQGEKMRAQIAAQAAAMQKQLAESKEKAKQQEEGIKSKAKNAADALAAKQKEAEEQEEGQKAALKAKQAEAAKEAEAVAAKAAAAKAAAKEAADKAAEEAASELKAKAAAKEAAERERDAARVKEATAKEALKAAAEKQAAEAKEKAAEVQRQKEAALEAKKKAELAAKDAAAKAAKEAAERKVKKEAADAKKKEEAEKLVKEQAVKRQHGKISLLKTGRPIGNGFARPQYAVDGDLCVLAGAAHYEDVATQKAGQINEFCRPAEQRVFDARVVNLAQARMDVRADGRVTVSDVRLNDGSRSSWHTFSGAMFPRAGSEIKKLQYNTHTYVTNYGGVYARMGYYVKDDLCVFQGLLRTNPGGFNPLFRLPDECRSKDGHIGFNVASNAGTTRLYVHQNGHLYYHHRPGPSTWVSLDGVAYYNSMKGQALDLQDGYRAWGSGWRGASWRREGRLCQLSGYAHNFRGHGYGLMATLPTECRPTRTLIFVTQQYHGHLQRYHLFANGELHWVEGHNHGGLFGLDGIRFMTGAPDFHVETKVEQRLEPLTGYAEGYAAPPAAYRKPQWSVAGNIVVLSGMVQRDVAKKATAKVLDLNMPAKYLPRTSRYFTLEHPENWKHEAHAEVILQGKGADSTAFVQWAGGLSDAARPWLALDGMLWAKRGSNLHSIELHTYWQAAGEGFETPSVYIQDGLCILNGAAVKRVRPHHDTFIGRMPVECRPVDGRLYLQMRAGKYSERLEIHRNGNMYRYNDRGYYGGRPALANRVIFDGLSFPARADNYLVGLPYMGPTGGVWRKPSFTVQDGLCVLSGSIYNSWPHARRAYIAELPSNCRPSARLVFGGLSFGRSERIDVLPDGRVLHVTDRAGRYHISLSGIAFKVDADSVSHQSVKPMVAAKLVDAASAKGVFSRGVVEYGQGYQKVTLSVIGGICFVNGRLRAGRLTRTLMTLPENCRPRAVRYFTFSREQYKASPIEVHSDGSLTLSDFGGANDRDYVDVNIAFPVTAAATTPVPLSGSFVDPAAGTKAALGYFRQGGYCMLDGFVEDILGQHAAFSRHQYKSGTIATLPAECRPQERAIFNGNHGKYVWRLDVLPDGRVHLDYRSGVQVKFVSLSDIRFFVSSGHKLSLLHSWRGYTAQHHFNRYKHHTNSDTWFYRHPSWNKEGQVCSLSGLLSSGGTYGPNPLIADLPTMCRPAGILRFSANNHQGPNRIEILPNGQVKYIGNDDRVYIRHHWVSLEGISWVVDSFEASNKNLAPASKEGVELKLENGFYPYEAMGQTYRRPMFTLVGKNKGITVLSGVAASADLGAQMTTLPAAARPDVPTAFDAPGANHRNGEFDVNADGTIVMADNRWPKAQMEYFTLDGAMFINKAFQGRSGLVDLYRGFAPEDRNSYAPPRWHLDGDLCIVSGMVKDAHNRNVHNTGLIGTLPPACRPKSGRLLFNTNHGVYNVRLDVLTNGQIHFVTGNNHRRYFPLNGISFTVKENAQAFDFVPSGYYPYNGFNAGYRVPGFTRIGDLCVLGGLFRPRGYCYGTIAVLPEKCRPRERLIFNVRQGGLGHVRVDVLPDGRLQWADNKAGCSWLSVDGIQFVVPDEDDLPFEEILPAGKITADKALEILKPWRDDGKYLEPRYQMYGKVCVISGVAEATSDFKSPMVTIPNECKPAGRVAVSVRGVDSNQNSLMRFDIGAQSNLQYVAGGGPNREMDVSVPSFMLVPKGVSMMPLQLKNNWYKFGEGYEAPRFVKQGRFCILQGMVRLGSGTNNLAQDHWHTLMAKTPPGCQVTSGNRLILHAGYHDRTRRLDITGDQIHVWEHGGVRHHDFVSLTGIFYSPQAGTALSPINGWHRYHSAYRRPEYMLEGGMCSLSGSLVRRSGSRHMVTLPQSCRPSKALVFQSTNAGNHEAYQVVVSSDGTVQCQAGMPSYVSLDQIIFKVAA